MPSLGQFRHPRYVAFLVAAAAGGANVIFVQQRVGPEGDAAVRAFLVGREALPAVADGAAELRRNVRAQPGMITVGLGRILHRGIFHAEMACGAAVHALQARQQCLVNLGRRGQNGGFGCRVLLVLRLKLQKASLIGLPRGCVGLITRCENKSQREKTERKEGDLQSAFHYSAPPTTCTHGGTSAQPGPRKKVPTTIKTRLATTKMVKSQRINLRSASRRLGFRSR